MRGARQYPNGYRPGWARTIVLAPPEAVRDDRVRRWVDRTPRKTAIHHRGKINRVRVSRESPGDTTSREVCARALCVRRWRGGHADSIVSVTARPDRWRRRHVSLVLRTTSQTHLRNSSLAFRIPTKLLTLPRLQPVGFSRVAPAACRSSRSFRPRVSALSVSPQGERSAMHRSPPHEHRHDNDAPVKHDGEGPLPVSR